MTDRNAALTELILALRSEIVQDSTLIPLFQKINTQGTNTFDPIPGKNSDQDNVKREKPFEYQLIIWELYKIFVYISCPF